MDGRFDVRSTDQQKAWANKTLSVYSASIHPSAHSSSISYAHFALWIRERCHNRGVGDGRRLCPGWFNTTTQIGQMSEPLGPILLKWRSRGRWTKAFEWMNCDVKLVVVLGLGQKRDCRSSLFRHPHWQGKLSVLWPNQSIYLRSSSS